MTLITISYLDEAIKKYQRDVFLKTNEEITIQEILEQIGEVAEVSWGTVKQIKNNVILPSLPVAIKIAEFFGVSVEDLWKVVQEETTIKKTKKGRKSNPNKEIIICSEEGCENQAVARKLCNKHYQQYRYRNLNLFKNQNSKLCSVEGCIGLHYAKGLCNFHYNIEYRNKRKKEESNNV